MSRWYGGLVAFAALGLLLGAPPTAADDDAVRIANDTFAVTVDTATGAITSLLVKELGCELIGEPRLAANFRINLPLPEYQCHYIDGMAQSPESVSRTDDAIEVAFSGLESDRGDFPIDLTYVIALADDALRFRARLTNHADQPVAEFWFPRLGGWTDFGANKDARVAVPNYIGCGHGVPLFHGYVGGRGLGGEAAEWAVNYPGMVMPWWDLHDAATDRGLYLGYHDPTFRLSTWHTALYPNATGRPGVAWMTPDEAAGEPVGLVFSHVRYPYIQSGETLDSGEFVLRYHRGDWHAGSKYYRQWFLEHFPFDKSGSWLRRKSAWFTSIIYQPEDKVIADYETYDRWTQDAQACGIDCFELIGWDRGGLERDYPAYVPEEKLGGRDGFRTLLRSIDERGGKCLVFVNYNVMDCNTEWYRRALHKYTHQDGFGNTPNWMAWGESTLTARLGLNVRRHVLASVVPGFEQILEDQFVELVKDGAHGLQIDKVVACSALDFNPLNTLKPDVALCEGLVQAIGRVYEKCRAVDPAFCLASEACQDRLIPYVDVFYRNSGGFDVAPLRYVFPEWTSCQHVAAPYDFNGVNAAVVTGSVICVEPDTYQNTLGHPRFKALGDYIREVERIRTELADVIFLGRYYDTLGASVNEVKVVGESDPPAYESVQPSALRYRVHGRRDTDQRAVVVANPSLQERTYFCAFLDGFVEQADLYEPFEPARTVPTDKPLTIKPQGLHVLVERGGGFAADLRLSMRCGVAGGEVVHAAEGYGARVLQGFSCASVGKWVPPVNHCRADENEIRIALTAPRGATGTLRLYVIDPDRFYGGRREEIFVDGTSLGIVEDFVGGRWLEHAVTPETAADGEVLIRVVNLNDAGNAVISIIEWLESGGHGT